jgi:NADPH:quinone reductase-like Zn-dependent oxidoreductase
MSKVVQFYEVGGPEVLKLEDVEKRQPGPDEVLINVKAMGLNRAEIMFREGKYLDHARSFPSRMGYEASGIVEAAGSNSVFKPGDKVSTVPAFQMDKYGVYGEWAIVPARAVVKHPENLSFEEAASIWMQYLTAYGALVEYGQLQSGQSIIITAASSSVGYAAIQLSKLIGAKSIATTRTSAKKQLLLEAGADHVIVTDEENLEEKVKSYTGGRGADMIFDPVAGPMLLELAKCAAFHGKIFEYGALSLQKTSYPLYEALKKGLTVRGYTLFEITSDDESFARGKKWVYDLLAGGVLKPKLDKHFNLKDIVEAQKYMESNQQNGKIVVVA